MIFSKFHVLRMIKQECRNTLNSLTLLKGRIRTSDQHNDSNIPISSQTNYYPFFHAALFLGRQLLPPALLAHPLNFNCKQGSSWVDVRSQAVMWVVTFLHAYILTELHRCMETRLWNQARLLESTPRESCSSVRCFI